MSEKQQALTRPSGCRPAPAAVAPEPAGCPPGLPPAAGGVAVGLLAALAGGALLHSAAEAGVCVVSRVVRNLIGSEACPGVAGRVVLQVRGEAESLELEVSGLPPAARFRVVLTPAPEPRRIPAAFLGSFVTDGRGRGRFALSTRGGGLARAFVVCDTDRNRKDFIGDPLPEPKVFLPWLKIFPARHGDRDTTFGPLVARSDGPLFDPAGP